VLREEKKSPPNLSFRDESIKRRKKKKKKKPAKPVDFSLPSLSCF